MTATYNRWPEAVAKRLKLSGMVDFTSSRVGQTLHIPCSRGHIVDFPITGNMPPDFVAKKMMQKGWTVGSKLICPKHSKKPKAAPAEQEEAKVTSAPNISVAGPADSTPAKTSIAAGKAKRMVFMALEDYYDEAAKAYKPGHSDKTIAVSCSLSEKAVRDIREESFGPLAGNSDAKDFRDALTKMRTDISQSVEKLRTDILTLERRLARLCEKHGWIE